MYISFIICADHPYTYNILQFHTLRIVLFKECHGLLKATKGLKKEFQALTRGPLLNDRFNLFANTVVADDMIQICKGLINVCIGKE